MDRCLTNEVTAHYYRRFFQGLQHQGAVPRPIMQFFQVIQLLKLVLVSLVTHPWILFYTTHRLELRPFLVLEGSTQPLLLFLQDVAATLQVIVILLIDKLPPLSQFLNRFYFIHLLQELDDLRIDSFAIDEEPTGRDYPLFILLYCFFDLFIPERTLHLRFGRQWIWRDQPARHDRQLKALRGLRSFLIVLEQSHLGRILKIPQQLRHVHLLHIDMLRSSHLVHLLRFLAILLHVLLELLQLLGLYPVEHFLREESGVLDDLSGDEILPVYGALVDEIVLDEPGLHPLQGQTANLVLGLPRTLHLIKLQKQIGACNLQIIRNSMKNSFKQITVTQPVPYPTLEELPSQHCILTLKEMDDKLNNLTLDIYTMFSVTQEIKNSLMHLNCSLEYFQKCGMRLMGLINCIFQHYGIDRYHFSKLMTCLRYCNSQWKRNLIKTLALLNSYPSAHSIFIYKMNRNIYLWMMLRTNNTILIKMLNRLEENKRLNAKSLKYLQHHNVFSYYEQAYTKIIEILQEKEEETYMKIMLINEFIKYILVYLNFCNNNRSRIDIFNKFFTIVQYLCRIMKKFYSPAISQYIKQSLSIIREGLKYYIEILERNPLNNIKIEQIRHIIRIIMQIPFKHVPSDNISQNSFVVKLIIRILNSWKKIHSKAERMKTNTITRSTQQLSINQFAKKQKENNLKQKIDNGKIDQIKIEFMKLNKSRNHLFRRKSQSLKSLNQFTQTNSTGQLAVAPSNNVKIRREIQGNMSKYFDRCDGLKMPRSFSRDKKRQLSIKRENEQKQLKLEDYSQHMQSRLKIVPNLNKIQLYRPQKMRQFCKKQLKLKLQSNPNGA